MLDPDEKIARDLQAQFDAEEEIARKQLQDDFDLAQKLASEAHKLSSSEDEHEPTSFRVKKRARLSSTLNATSATGSSICNSSFYYLNKVTAIPERFNDNCTIGIRDLLSSSKGQLISSAQFNYMFDVTWLIDKYPPEFRTKPLLIVHSHKDEIKRKMISDAAPLKNITFSEAPINIPFGVHHTKMMLLLYEHGLQIIIHTANLVPQDWHQKTQGIWVSPVFPKEKNPGDSSTNFKRDLLEYLSAYNTTETKKWCSHIAEHDTSSCKVFIVGSVPGRHLSNKLNNFGHMKLRQVLKTTSPCDSKWPIIGQFSSIGSLGPSQETWLSTEWLQSLSSTSVASTGNRPKLQLIFPSVENVRTSLEGYPAGASLPYSHKVASKQQWLNHFLHVWKSDTRGRSQASPHIKSYTRISPAADTAAWFLLTSANLSKAAWGSLEKNNTQLFIRSYELGVLFNPKQFGQEYFNLSVPPYTGDESFPLPYDIPPSPYAAYDEPWIWDIPHCKKPDRHGNAWSPS